MLHLVSIDEVVTDVNVGPTWNNLIPLVEFLDEEGLESRLLVLAGIEDCICFAWDNIWEDGDKAIEDFP